MFNNGPIDLAGGIVVHTTAGISALILAKMLGSRTGFPKRIRPAHHSAMVMIGASMLWGRLVWLQRGFPSGCNEAAGMTMLLTHISAAVASLTWMVVEWCKNGKPGLVGIATGMVAGLPTITPASGAVGAMGAMCIGFLAGLVCYFACGIAKHSLKIDDSLDVFAVNAVGGSMDTILVAAYGVAAFGGSSYHQIGAQLMTQVKGGGVTLIWSGIGTVVIVYICKVLTGLRVTEEVEHLGLDQSEHGETSYHFD